MQNPHSEEVSFSFAEMVNSRRLKRSYFFFGGGGGTGDFEVS